MYRLQIAEDEPLAREGILRSVDFAAHGFTVVAVSEDGKMALDDFKRVQPDLVITDINMPYMTGLEFARAIAAFAKPARVVILTGYDEFEYARSAILAGVSNYILKPVTAKEFSALLDTERQALDKERQLEAEQSAAAGRLRALSPVMRDLSFERLIQGSIDPEQAWTLGFDRLSERRYAEVGLIRVRHFDEMAVRLELGRDLLLFAVANIVSELAEREDECFVFTMSDANTGVLYVTDREDVLPSRLRMLLADAKQTLRDTVGIETDTGQGEFVDQMARLPHSYAQAKEALDLPPVDDSANAVIRHAEDFIEKHYTDSGLSLLEVARHVNISISHFTNQFKVQTGKTFVEYLTDVRIEKAKRLLTTTDLMLYRIASEVGYENPTYFTSLFKKTAGCSPREYRKMYRNGNT